MFAMGVMISESKCVLTSWNVHGQFDVKIMNINFQFIFFPFATDQIQSASAPWGCNSWHFNTPNRLISHDSSADPFPEPLHFPHWQIRQTSHITAQPSLKPSPTDRDLAPSLIW